MAQPLKSVKFKRFQSGQPLLDQLSADRLNQMLAAIEANQVIFGQNVSGTRTPGGAIVRAKPQVGGGSSSVTPFLVQRTTDDSDPPLPALKLVPGKIATLVPTVDGVPLDQAADNPSQPWIYTPGEDFSVLLRIQIDLTDPSIQFRSHISAVTVVTSDDAGVVADVALIGVAGKVPELVVVWEGDTDADIEAKNVGHFYVLVADVGGSLDGDGNIVIGEITQWLYSNYLTFAVAGDDIVVLV